jgi:hypothetical protein
MLLIFTATPTFAISPGPGDYKVSTPNGDVTVNAIWSIPDEWATVTLKRTGNADHTYNFWFDTSTFEVRVGTQRVLLVFATLPAGTARVVTKTDDFTLSDANSDPSLYSSTGITNVKNLLLDDMKVLRAIRAAAPFGGPMEHMYAIATKTRAIIDSTSAPNGYSLSSAPTACTTNTNGLDNCKQDCADAYSLCAYNAGSNANLLNNCSVANINCIATCHSTYGGCEGGGTIKPAQPQNVPSPGGFY